YLSSLTGLLLRFIHPGEYYSLCPERIDPVLYVWVEHVHKELTLLFLRGFIWSHFTTDRLFVSSAELRDIIDTLRAHARQKHGPPVLLDVSEDGHLANALEFAEKLSPLVRMGIERLSFSASSSTWNVVYRRDHDLEPPEMYTLITKTWTMNWRLTHTFYL